MKEATGSRLRIRHVDPEKLKPWEKNPRKLKYAVGPVAKVSSDLASMCPFYATKTYMLLRDTRAWRRRSVWVWRRCLLPFFH